MQRRRNDSLRVASNIELDEDEMEMYHLQQQQSTQITVASESMLSPYKMNPGYRRPPPGTESDNGYSTMTPLNGGTDLDSEIIQPYTASGPARERMLRHQQLHQRPPPSLYSVTSGVSTSRTSSPAPSFIQPQQQLRQLKPIKQMMSDDCPLSSSESTSNNAGGTGTVMIHSIDEEQTNLKNPNQMIVAAIVHT